MRGIAEKGHLWMETRKKRWQYFVRPDGRVESICPTLHNGNVKEHEDKRELYEEFKELTNVVMVHGYKGWITDILITLPNIMRMLQKLGAQPYQAESTEWPPISSPVFPGDGKHTESYRNQQVRSILKAFIIMLDPIMLVPCTRASMISLSVHPSSCR